MISCCDGYGVGWPSFPVSSTYILLISLMVSSYSSFYDDLLFILVMYRIGFTLFSS